MCLYQALPPIFEVPGNKANIHYKSLHIYLNAFLIDKMSCTQTNTALINFNLLKGSHISKVWWYMADVVVLQIQTCNHW